MSLYFNWSCDFQRFTKSKKLSKFQVRTTTFVLLNKSLSTSLFNLQGTICCFALVSELFSSSTLADSLFSIPQYAPNVNTFLQLFSKKFLQEICTLSIYLYNILLLSKCPENKTPPAAVHRQSRKLCATLCLFRCIQYISHIQKIFLLLKITFGVSLF